MSAVLTPEEKWAVVQQVRLRERAASPPRVFGSLVNFKEYEGILAAVEDVVDARLRRGSLVEFLLTRVEEEEVLAASEWCPDGVGAAKILAECEAKRAIISWHRDNCQPDYTLQILAAIYADHSDYREEWRP